MPAMIVRNAARKTLAPWTDPALVLQMAKVKSVLEKAPLDLKNLSNHCLLLSKILDSLVADKQKPNYRHDLLPLVQQVCKYKDKPEVRPALLLLLLSIKSAFRTDWLSTLEISGNKEIFATLNLLFDSFTTSNENVAQASLQPLQSGGSAVKEPLEATNYLVSISDRFFPRLALNAVFVAVQAKLGYEVLMCDFHVPHMHKRDRVRLYVSNTDSIETATCLISPPQVNILVNGQQVFKRVTTGSLDVGPQMPSDVSRLVKVGANVLQVIGEFSGSYFIAVASSRTIERSAKNSHLEDYVAPTIAASSEVGPTEVDDEVVEGASRLSLRCPISHQRLVLPVKATTCRHLQCFDYDSFLDINEKRPAWRCPCCNRFISWPDLRIDRIMDKVLKETDEKIHDVIISQDGSWLPVSIGENQSNSGSQAVPVEGCEVGSKVIHLSDTADEELANGIRQNSNDIQLPERKPDKQALQAINDNRVPGTAGVPVHSQPAPSAQLPPAANHNSQGNDLQSHASPHMNRPTGPVNGYRISTQLQQPQICITSNTGFVTRIETENHVNQHLGQPQQQWGGPGVPPYQLVTNTAQIQNFQQSQQFDIVHSSQVLVSHSAHETPVPGINSQRLSRGLSGPRPGQQPSSSANATPMPSGTPALEQSWQPGTIRMRGSIANPSVGRGVPGQTPRAPQQRCAFNTVPHHDDNVPDGCSGIPLHPGQFQVRVPAPGNPQTVPPSPGEPRG